MKREIKFRGQKVDTKKWIEGDLVHDYWIQGDIFLKTAIRYLIKGLYSFPIEVIPESVGQFTGLHDKNGKEIYEGDLVKFYTMSSQKNGIISKVQIFEGRLLPFYADEYIQDEQGDWFEDSKGFEIIGNIFENPELINQH